MQNNVNKKLNPVQQEYLRGRITVPVVCRHHHFFRERVKELKDIVLLKSVNTKNTTVKDGYANRCNVNYVMILIL
jgi:hypothetical protein